MGEIALNANRVPLTAVVDFGAISGHDPSHEVGFRRGSMPDKDDRRGPLSGLHIRMEGSLEQRNRVLRQWIETMVVLISLVIPALVIAAPYHGEVVPMSQPGQPDLLSTFS